MFLDTTNSMPQESLILEINALELLRKLVANWPLLIESLNKSVLLVNMTTLSLVKMLTN